MNRFGPQSKNLASIIRGFKSAVTQYARIHQIAFAWQTGFHDSIIWNASSFRRITKYIRNNPDNWNKDEFFL
jgi:putative transposase